MFALSVFAEYREMFVCSALNGAILLRYIDRGSAQYPFDETSDGKRRKQSTAVNTSRGQSY